LDRRLTVSGVCVSFNSFVYNFVEM